MSKQHKTTPNTRNKNSPNVNVGSRYALGNNLSHHLSSAEKLDATTIKLDEGRGIADKDKEKLPFKGSSSDQVITDSVIDDKEIASVCTESD